MSTEHDYLAALEGRDPAADDRDARLRSAIEGRDSATADRATRLTGVLRGDDPAATERDAATVAALEGTPEAHPWQARMDMALAVEAYRDAFLRKYPTAFTLDAATEQAEKARDRYLAGHRAEHVTEAALHAATVAHLQRLTEDIAPVADGRAVTPVSESPWDDARFPQGVGPNAARAARSRADRAPRSTTASDRDAAARRRQYAQNSKADQPAKRASEGKSSSNTLTHLSGDVTGRIDTPETHN